MKIAESDMSATTRRPMSSPTGGGLDAGGQWRSTPSNFFLPCEPLSILYRQKLRTALADAAMLDKVDPSVWSQSWVVDCQAVGDGSSAVKYLAPYVFRVAISDRRIVACNETHVSFRYQPSGTRKQRTMTVDASEFVRRFLQHVLPSRLQKVRHYGFLSSHARHSIESLQWLVAAALDRLYELAWFVEIVTPAQPKMACAECGLAMIFVGYQPARPARWIEWPRSRPP